MALCAGLLPCGLSVLCYSHVAVDVAAAAFGPIMIALSIRLLNPLCTHDADQASFVGSYEGLGYQFPLGLLKLELSFRTYMSNS